MAENFYEMYLEEMGQVAPLDREEEASVLKKAAQGDSEARNRLVEGSLSRVLSIAKEYENRELPMQDIVQEANMALMEAAAGYKEGADWNALLEDLVKERIEAALKEQKEEMEIEENMAARVNVLQTVSQVLAKELGREATVEELAEKMKMTREEIKDIMKLALDALTINGEGQAASETEETVTEEPRSNTRIRDGYGRRASTPRYANPIRDGWDFRGER